MNDYDYDCVCVWCRESAGAATVTAHMSNTHSWPYFTKAIFESGAFNGWSYKPLDAAIANGNAFARHLNCTDGGGGGGREGGGGARVAAAAASAVNVSCLVHANASLLAGFGDDGMGVADNDCVNATEAWCDYALPYSDAIDQSLWGPVIDGVEFLYSPPVALSKGQVARYYAMPAAAGPAACNPWRRAACQPRVAKVLQRRPWSDVVQATVVQPK